MFYLAYINVTEVLQLVDQLIFEETRKHLDDIQRVILEGTWQKYTYNEIAQKHNFSKNHVGDAGYQLWQLLSKQLGEDIKKSNFRSTIERLNIRSFPVIIQNHNKQNNNHNFNFSSQTLFNSKDDNQEKIINNQSKLNHHDLSLAPKKISNFGDRQEEMETLTQRILTQKKPLISVLGLSGIGKTTLVRHFVDLNLEKFEVIIWKNLKLSNSLDTIITDIFTKINTDFILNDQDKLTLFLNLLQQKKCLIIFDNIEELFNKGELAGQYQTKHHEYEKLFSIITTEIEHQSSLILISQEQCSQMYYDSENFDLLELQGLNSQEIFHNFGLKNEESWLKLVQFYEGNPTYLKDISVLIKDVYDGYVSDFLEDQNIVITPKIQENLTKIFKRLSPIEKQIIQALSNAEKLKTRNELKSNLDVASPDLIKGLQSLQRRYLLTKIEAEEILFNLSPVFKKFINDTNIETE